VKPSALSLLFSTTRAIQTHPNHLVLIPFLILMFILHTNALILGKLFLLCLGLISCAIIALEIVSISSAYFKAKTRQTLVLGPQHP